MRQIVNGNEGLNIMLNAIVDKAMDMTLDEMITTVKEWQKSTNVVSCDTVISMLMARKSN